MPKVIKGFAQETRSISIPEALEEAGRCYLCHDAPCSKASPANTDVAGFISRMRSRNFRGALRLVKESNFFPGITSRVSPYGQQCESPCLHRKYGGPIRIAELERVLADYDISARNPYLPPVSESSGKTVAVVGSGPTGLAAAVELVLGGCKVIIYESSRIPGGVLTKGVPGYLISDTVIDHEVGGVLQLGVDLVTGINVGQNINLVSLKNSYDALLITIGMGIPRRIEVPGNDQGEIFTGLEILESLKLKEKRLRVGEKVMVIGGGSVALDVATSMRKLGIKDVTLIYRKKREHMPVFDSRFNQCLESGVVFEFCTELKQINNDGQKTITEIVCIRNRISHEEGGKVESVPLEGSEFTMPADTVIFCVGQELDRTLVDCFELKTTGEGTIEVDPETSRTSDPFIFAAGSCVARTDTIIEAIAGGRRVAQRIIRQLAQES
ncbi:MAG: FAD-dependent oxidoreductase [Gemmatimonadota bacterium]|nr:FAD-dependent oxidoreductase [Gemmatimonadota bacterium]